MLRGDLHEIWRYGKLNHGIAGDGVTVVGLRPGGSAPQEYRYVPIAQLSSIVPDAIIGMANALQQSDGQVVFIMDTYRQCWQFCCLTPDLVLVDLLDEIVVQAERRVEINERRKTRTRKRKG